MITILHTNDIHGHIEPWTGWEGDLAGRRIGVLDRLASAIRRVRAAVGPANVLLLDAGDAIGDTMIAAETQGQATVDLLARLRYDAMALGNHEPDYGLDRLDRYANRGQIPILAANVTRKSTGALFCRPYLVKEIAGLRVAILGLAYPNTPLTTAPENVEDLIYRQDSTDVVRECLAQLEAHQPELVVVLSHLGLTADLRLAKEVAGVDVIVGGHSHNRMRQATRVNGVLVVQAGAQCSDLGRLDLTIKGGRITDVRRELILLDHAGTSSDEEMSDAMKLMLEPLRPALDEVIATAATPIVRAQTLAGQEPRKRDAESPADSLFADILRERTGAEIALLPGVGYGVAIPAGPVSASALRNLVPHASAVVTVTMTGRQVRATLEQALRNTFSQDPKAKVGGMIQVSGLRFTCVDEPSPSVRDLVVWGAPLEAGRRYRVATNGMMAEGGHNYREFLQAEGRREHGKQYELVRDWMGEHSPVRTPAAGRIRCVN